jgi:hypothetical protein
MRVLAILRASVRDRKAVIVAEPEVRHWADRLGYSVIGEPRIDGTEAALVTHEFSDIDGGRLVLVCLRCWSTSLSANHCDDIQAVLDYRRSIGIEDSLNRGQPDDGQSDE